MSDVTPRMRLPLLVTGQGQKDVTHNEALLLLDTLVRPLVERRDLRQPPESVGEGQCWLVPLGASGAWLGADDHIAVWTAGGWRFVPVPDGMEIYVREEALSIRHIADEWKVVAPFGAPAPPIDTPSGGSVVDAEARSTLASVIARLRTLGLIES